MDQTSAEKVTRLLQGTVGEVCPRAVDYTDEFVVRGVVHGDTDVEDVSTTLSNQNPEELAGLSMDAVTRNECKMEELEVNAEPVEISPDADTATNKPEVVSPSLGTLNSPQVALTQPQVAEVQPDTSVAMEKDSCSAETEGPDEVAVETSEKDNGTDTENVTISGATDMPKNLSVSHDEATVASEPVNVESAKTDDCKVEENSVNNPKPDQRKEEWVLKKRRRRKPLKVSKQEYIQSVSLADLTHGDKLDLSCYDQNFNSLEAEAKTKPEDLSSNARSLVNSLVAHAMKIWYDDELPRPPILMSPMKTISSSKLKMAGCLKMRVDKDKIYGNKSLDFSKIKGTQDVSGTPHSRLPQQHCQENQNNRSPHLDGVAPDDHFYSMPSQASMDEDSGCNSTKPESWKPNKTLHSSLLASMPYSDRSPVAAPLLGKAMQTLRVPSPAVSPSLGSDQESPSTGPKLYLCNICNKSFTFATNLTRHQRNIHGRPCRRRMREGLLKGSDDQDRDFSASSDDTDHQTERRGTALSASTPLDSASTPRITPKLEPLELDTKTSRYSPSLMAADHMEQKPHANILPPYLMPVQREQEYVVITPREMVSCSLCLTTFDSPSQLSRHEATCRGIDRSTVFSDASGAIDLSKPKVSEHKLSVSEGSAFKPKFNYLHSDMRNKKGSKGCDSPLNLSSVSYFSHQAALPKTMEIVSANMSIAQSGFLPIMEQVVPSDLKMLSSVATGDIKVPVKRPHKCSFCKKRFSTFKSLTKHTSFVHKVNLAGMQHLHGDNASMVALATAEMELLAEQSGTPLNLSVDGHGMAIEGHSMACHLCKLCGQTFSSLTNLRHHVCLVHLGDAGPSRSNTSSPDTDLKAKLTNWVCDICAQNFASKRNLYRHLNHVHKVNQNGIKDGSEVMRDQKPTANEQPSPKEVYSQHQHLPLSVSPLTIPRPNLSQSTDVCERMSLPDHQKVPQYETSVSSVHHLQDVVDRVLSREEGLIRERCTPHDDKPIKLPRKKAIMEEYHKETYMKMRLEQEQKLLRLAELQRVSPVLDLSPSAEPQVPGRQTGLNLSTHSVNSEGMRAAPKIPTKEAEPCDTTVIDLSNGKSQVNRSLDCTTEAQVPPKETPCMPALDLSQDKSGRKGEKEPVKVFPVNPFSAILNLSQTYLRKLLNDTPATPGSNQSGLEPPNFSTKDKENSMDKESYTRNLGYPKANQSFAVREYQSAETSKLREMLTSKVPGLNGPGITNTNVSNGGSCPSSGRGSPMSISFDEERRPLVMTSVLDNQPLDHSYSGSEISPLRSTQNKAIRKKLKETIMDQNREFGSEKKPKNQRKRKSLEHLNDNPLKEKLLDTQEPQPKKLHKEALEEKSNFDSNGNLDAEKTDAIDSIKMGEFPAIAVGKRHICGLCGASFTFQTNLTRHQRKLHGKPFVRKSSLNQSMNVENLKAESNETGPVPVKQEAI